MQKQQNPTEAVGEAYKTSPIVYLLRGVVLVAFSYRSTIGAQVRFFASNLSERHLEAPCGNGTVLWFVLKERGLDTIDGLDITGIDIATEMLPDAVEKFKDYPNIHFEYGDVTEIPAPDERFQSINVPNGLHSFPDPSAALADLYRVLAPGGVLAANVLLHPRGNAVMQWAARRLNAWGQRKALLKGPFEEEEIVRLIEDRGLEVFERRVHGNTLYLKARRPAA